MSASDSILALWREAVAVREQAHAPYSSYRVGAAVALEGIETPALGCNVENASYGATLCAERNAITHAVARHGASIRLHTLVLVTAPEAATPCGMCLQVMAEFAGPELEIWCGTLKNPGTPYRLDQLLPHAFRSDRLSP